MSETAVTSFILRFTQDQQSLDAPWHGVIRHVQNSEEIRFTRIEDALAFMNSFVPLDAAPSDDLVVPASDDALEGE